MKGWLTCWLSTRVSGEYWHHVVNTGRMLLERTAALDTARTCTYSAVMRWVKGGWDLCDGSRGADNKG